MLLLVVAAALISTLPRFLYVGDPVAIRATSISWLNAGSLAVPPAYAASFGERGQYFFENPRTGQWTTKYGIANVFLYVPPLIVEKWISGRLPFYESLDPSQYRLRSLLLGLYHTVFAVALAAYLFRLALFYDPRPVYVGAFVIFAFFATFLWNYLRAHTIESFHVFFFTAAFYHLVRIHRMSPRRLTDTGVWPHVMMAVLFTSLLLLSKTVYVLLVPIVLLALAFANSRWAFLRCPRSLPSLIIEDRGRSFVCLAVVPLLSAVALLLWTNWYRFGSVVETGYSQWQPMSEHFTLDVREALLGFAFDPRKSVFLHFPLLAFSLVLFPAFVRRYPWESVVGGVVLVVFTLTISCFTYWRGDWSYGPRYLLFFLPVASLPLLLCFEKPGPLKWFRPALLVAMSLVVAWSTKCQIVVNSLEWFTPFRVEAVLEQLDDDGVETLYLQPYWTINEELMGLKRADEATPPLSSLSVELPPDRHADVHLRLASLLDVNLFWLDRAQGSVAARASMVDATVGRIAANRREHPPH